MTDGGRTITPEMQKTISGLIEAVHEYEAEAEDPTLLKALQSAAVKFIAATRLKIKTPHHDSMLTYSSYLRLAISTTLASVSFEPGRQIRPSEQKGLCRHSYPWWF